MNITLVRLQEMIQEEIDDSLEEADCPGEEGVCIEPPDSNSARRRAQKVIHMH